MALVVVMGTAAVTAVMAAHVMLLSETIAREAVVAADRSHLKYSCESAADRAFWLHVVDRRLFANRALGSANLERDQYPGPPWMLDGKPHAMTELDCVAALQDASRGIDFSGSEPGAELRNQVDPEDVDRRDLVEAFLDIAADYVDPNDQYRPPGGMEQQDYEAEGYPTLPRNAPMEFREEVYWLPGWRDVLYSRVRIIPPEGLAFPEQGSAAAKPPFFSSSASLIRERLNLSEVEVEAILEARRRWQEEGIPLTETVDAGLLGQIRGRFSLVESGVVTVEVQGSARNGEVSRRLTVTRSADISRPDATIAGGDAWALWRRRFR